MKHNTSRCTSCNTIVTLPSMRTRSAQCEECLRKASARARNDKRMELGRGVEFLPPRAGDKVPVTGSAETFALPQVWRMKNGSTITFFPGDGVPRGNAYVLPDPEWARGFNEWDAHTKAQKNVGSATQLVECPYCTARVDLYGAVFGRCEPARVAGGLATWRTVAEVRCHGCGGRSEVGKQVGQVRP